MQFSPQFSEAKGGHLSRVWNKIVFIGLTLQKLILHENVKMKIVLFKYYLQLFHLTFPNHSKIKSCQVIAENPFPPFFAVVLAIIARSQKNFN